MKKLIAIMALVPLVSVSSVSVADWSGERSAKMEKRGGHRGGGHLFHFFRDLDLTSAQKEQIKALVEEQRDATEDLRTANRELRFELVNIAMSSNYTVEAYNTRLSSFLDNQRSMMLQRSATENQVYQLLTAEQQVLLQQKLAGFDDSQRSEEEDITSDE